MSKHKSTITTLRKLGIVEPKKKLHWTKTPEGRAKLAKSQRARWQRSRVAKEKVEEVSKDLASHITWLMQEPKLAAGLLKLITTASKAGGKS